MFDISTQAVVDTAPLHLKNAKGDRLFHDGKPVRIHIYGPGSKQFAEVEARQTQRVLKRREDNDGKVTIASPEQRALEAAEDLATVTADFENFAYPPAGNAKGALLFTAVYADPKLGFIAEQVGKFSANWGNFSAGSATG